jgi:hypothetical protein
MNTDMIKFFNTEEQAKEEFNKYRKILDNVRGYTYETHTPGVHIDGRYCEIRFIIICYEGDNFYGWGQTSEEAFWNAFKQMIPPEIIDKKKKKFPKKRKIFMDEIIAMEKFIDEQEAEWEEEKKHEHKTV